MNTSRGAVFASLLWTKLISDNIQRRVDNISRQFTGAGWKDLPQELVNEILGYLLDDLAALKACSLTCKYLFGATRPLIHKWLCLASRQDQKAHPEPKGSLFSRRKRVPEAFERLVGADRSGLLRYTRHLTFEMESDSFSLRNIQEYLPRLRSITELHTLTLITPRAYLFIQVFAEYFGIFTNTLRHLDLDIRNAHGAATAHQFLHIICQFPLLEDLSIVSPDKAVVHPGYPVSTITWSPPFRGKLLLAQMYPGALSEGLATLPGGLHFRSLELIWCRCPGIQAVLTASSGTVASVSYLWPVRDSGYTAPLNLGGSVVLERFELRVHLFSIYEVPRWIHGTLQTINSPFFKEVVFSILNASSLWRPTGGVGWNDVDVLLNALAERNPDFRVVFKGNWFHPGNVRDGCGEICALLISYLPLVSSKGLVEFESLLDAEGRLLEWCFR